MTVRRESYSIGRQVICDGCSNVWTDRDDEGGVLFGSKAYCPDCAPGVEAAAIKFRETEHIHGRCPPGTSYADWVRWLRGPGAGVTITSASSLDELIDEIMKPSDPDT